MAVAVQNTLVGLGQTIDLLKQILTEIRNTKQDENVQPADMQVSKRITKSSNKESGIASTTDAIASVSKVNTKGLTEKTAAINESIKALTDKNVIAGITKLGLLYATGFIGLFNKGITSIFNTITELNNSTRAQYKQIKNFSEAIDGFVKSINSVTNLILKMAALSLFVLVAAPLALVGFTVIGLTLKAVTALYNWLNIETKGLDEKIKAVNEFANSIYVLSGIVLVAAAVGAITVFLFKYAVVGFIAIAATALGVTMIYKMVTHFAEFNETTSKNLKSFILSIYSLAGIVLVAAAVGAIAIFAWDYILVGFATIAATAIITVGVMYILGLAGDIAKSSVKSFMLYAATLFMLGGVVMLSAAVGAIALSNFAQTMTGLGLITGLLLVTTGIFLLLNFAKSTIMKALPAFLILSVSLFGFAYLVKYIAGISSEVEAAGGVSNIYKILGVMGTMIGGITLIMAGLGALVTSGIGAGILVAGAAAILGIAGVVFVLGKLVLSINDVSSQITDYNKLYETLGHIGTIMTKMSLLTIKIGALAAISMPLIVAGTGTILAISTVFKSLADTVNIVNNLSQQISDKDSLLKTFDTIDSISWKMMKLTEGIGALALISAPLIALGNITLIGISGVIISLTKAAKEIINATALIDDVGGVNEFNNKSLLLTDSLTYFIENVFAKLMPYRNASRRFKRLMEPLGMVINDASKFLKMLSTFTSVGDSIAPVFYKNDGSYTIGAPINVATAGANIGEGFGIFADNLMKVFKKYNKKTAKTAKKMADTLDVMIDPVNKFASLMKVFQKAENNVLTAYVTKNGEIEFDKKGNPKTYKIQLNSVASNIATSFTAFSTILLRKLEDVDSSGVSNKTVKILNNSIEPINTFVDAILKADWDENGNLVKDGKNINIVSVGNAMGKSLNSFFTSLNNALPSGGPFSGANNKKTALEGYSALLTSLGSFFANVDKLSAGIDKSLTDNISNFLKDIYEVGENVKASDSAIELVSNTKELTDTLFKNAQNKIKNLKEYYENTKLIAEQLERAANAMEKISKHQDLDINIKNNQQNSSTTSSANTQGSQNAMNTTNNINNTTNYNNVPGSQNNTTNDVDYTEIVKAIREGFDGISKMTVVMDSGDEINLDLAFGR